MATACVRERQSTKGRHGHFAHVIPKLPPPSSDTLSNYIKLQTQSMPQPHAVVYLMSIKCKRKYQIDFSLTLWVSWSLGLCMGTNRSSAMKDSVCNICFICSGQTIVSFCTIPPSIQFCPITPHTKKDTYEITINKITPFGWRPRSGCWCTHRTQRHTFTYTHTKAALVDGSK